MSLGLTPRTIVITTTNKKSTEMSVNPDVMMDDFDEVTETGEARKRRRLTHLSPDEKFLRRKLKNRVAAQTARDRKKALMSDMEIAIAKLEAENKKLQKENSTLRLQSTSLETENQSLKERLGQCDHISTDLATSDKLETKSSRSAASAVPLLKEQISTSIRWMEQYKACTVILSLLLSLVYCSRAENRSLGASRKRKQSHPSRLIRIESKPSVLKQLQPPWWGPHQQSWNPSMN